MKTDDTNGQTGSKLSFERVTPLRAHEYVAEQLRRHIALGIVGAGEAFPSERQLAEMFGVGRATVQHAVRILEADRLVESRRGRNGGTYVIGVKRDELSRQRLLLDLRASRKEVEDALVYRRAVELASVRLAAEVGDDEAIAEIAAANAGMLSAESEEEYHRHDTEFHVSIGRASGNTVLQEAVERARLLLNSAIVALPETELWHRPIDILHNEILHAIGAHDPERAVEAMAEHLKQTEKGIRALLAALR